MHVCMYNRGSWCWTLQCISIYMYKRGRDDLFTCIFLHFNYYNLSVLLVSYGGSVTCTVSQYWEQFSTEEYFALHSFLHYSLLRLWYCIKFLSLLFRIIQTRLVYLCKGMVICLFSNPTTPSIFLFFSLYNHYIHDRRYTIQYTLYIIYIMLLYYIALFAVLW